MASTHQESVRAFLNALVGKRSGQPQTEEDDDSGPRADFSLGDETADGEQALELDDRFGSDAQLAVGATDSSKQRLRRQQQYVKDTQATMAAAVERFLDTLHEEARNRPLGVVDLLRLRALLLIMVVLGAGSKKSDLLPKELNATVSRRQVLPSKGEVNWRRLFGKLLSGFFRNHGGIRGPLSEKVVLDVDGELGLPDDVLECWTTCYWALCATRAAVDERGAPIKLTDGEQKIAQDLYRYTRLLPEEALSESVKVIFEGMGARYGERIGASDTAVMQEHEQLVSASRRQSATTA